MKKFKKTGELIITLSDKIGVLGMFENTNKLVYRYPADPIRGLNVDLHLAVKIPVIKGDLVIDSEKNIFKAEKNNIKDVRVILASTNHDLSYFPDDFLKSFVKTYNENTYTTTAILDCYSVLEGVCNCLCHKPGIVMMHIMPCCNPYNRILPVTNMFNEISLNVEIVKEIEKNLNSFLEYFSLDDQKNILKILTKNYDNK